jgi:hypothetical protein
MGSVLRFSSILIKYYVFAAVKYISQGVYQSLLTCYLNHFS